MMTMMKRPKMRNLLAVAIGAFLAVGASTEGTAQNWRTVSMSRQLEGERSVDVSVDYGAGEFTVRPADQSVLYRMQLRYDEDVFAPVHEYERGRLHLGTETIGRGVRLGKRDDSGALELFLSTGVSMDLDMDFGAVKADIDLGGMRLTRLDISTGASQTRFDVSEPNPERMSRASFEVGAADFTARQLGNLNADEIEIDAGVGDIKLELTGSWERDAHVGVDMGLGSLELRVPKGLGVKLVKDTFLTSLDPEGLVKQGDAYYSLDYEEADVKVTIDVDAAFGSIRVVWVR